MLAETRRSPKDTEPIWFFHRTFTGSEAVEHWGPAGRHRETSIQMHRKLKLSSMARESPTDFWRLRSQAWWGQEPEPTSENLGTTGKPKLAGVCSPDQPISVLESTRNITPHPTGAEEEDSVLLGKCYLFQSLPFIPNGHHIIFLNRGDNQENVTHNFLNNVNISTSMWQRLNFFFY